MSGNSAKCRETKRGLSEALVCLADACRRNRGKMVLPASQITEFQTVVKEGGRHAVSNKVQPDSSFKNQAVLCLGPGDNLVFEIYTPQPL